MKRQHGWQLFPLFALVLLTCSSVAAALPLGDELLAPAAPRSAPRSRPEIAPQPAIFSSRQVLYAARAANGTRMVTVERGDKGDELWLYSFGAVPELPRLLHASPVRLAAPALNHDGTLVAFVDAQDDVKGDIWLLDLTRQDAAPRRLTGRESADDAPVFTVDGASVVYHRQLPGVELRELVRLHLGDNRSEPLHIGIDAAFATPAPDGQRWLFVSRKSDANGDLWMWNERGGAVTQLTKGAARDLYPAWETADTLLFTRQSSAGGNSATGQEPGQIYRLQLKMSNDDGFPAAFPLTSAALMAVAPLPAGDVFYFVAGLAGGGQVMYLPASGEIPDRPTVTEQWGVARILLERQPADPPHARLACARVLAREESPTLEGALAGLALGGLMEQAGEDAQAEDQYAAVARRYVGFLSEAALAGIARIRVQAAQRCGDVVLQPQRQEIIRAAQQAMKAVAAGKGADATARYLIDSARLLADFGGGAADLLAAVGLAEQVAQLKDAARPLKAEAALRRAVLLSRLEKGAGAIAALVEVATTYADQEEWAEAAITAVLDQVSPRDRPDQAALSALAERYRTSLPRMAMGAWNRQGDVAYRAGEWAKAKDAYRTVLEKFPALPTPTAAARFALAEVLYREERYAEAKALYETEMKLQPEDTPLYQLARAAYIRKTVAAGESLYRIGEIAAARSTFLDLIRYDGRSVEAHRGYIKSVAAMGQTAELLELYRTMLASYPDDAVLLYATGLTQTYLPGKENLTEADRLIARAAERMPSSEYPPQTRGYLAEISETVHGERGGLERAFAFYRRAWLLNRPLEQPDNRANLNLNIGNIAFLLGSKATAWNFYSQRLASGIPFDNPDTELIFQQRYGAVAFQMREKEATISGYQRALQLAEERLNPSRPLLLFGRLSRRVVERLFSEPERNAAAEAALGEHQAINAELERLGATPPEAPPSAGWTGFDATLRALLKRQRALVASAPSWNSAAGKSSAELNSMATAVEKELDAVPRLVESAAEIHDRLGLAYLEADRFGAAREQFDAAFTLNSGLGFTGNLVSNRRSASIAAYKEAHEASGEEQMRLLRLSRDGFTELLKLIETHPPKSKAPAKRSGGLVELSANVALDKGGSTAAAFGFSAEQEKRLAEIYLARINSELGNPAAAAVLLTNQLQRYPADASKIAVRDLYGVTLLAHRSAHVDYALGDLRKAASGFHRSTLLSLEGGNPISAMLNLINWGELLAVEAKAADVDDFLSAEAAVSRLAEGSKTVLPPLVYGRYHNDAGALLVRLTPLALDDGSRQALLYKALGQWDRTLQVAADSGDLDVLHEQRRQRVAAQLNRGAVLAALGLADAAQAARIAALEEARGSAAYSFEWRALAALGRYDEALGMVEHLPLTEYDLQRGELMERFAPHLESLAATNPEQAFALLERLSELERVQLLGRGALGLDDPATAGQFRAAAPHLAEIDRLRDAPAKAAAADKDYLQLRLQQEQAVVDDLFGAKLGRIPSYYTTAGTGALRLAAASVELSTLSRQTASPEHAAALKTAQQRFSSLQSQFNKECYSGKGGTLCRLISPQPVELIDVLESMPGKTLLRFTPLDSERWLLFTLGGKSGIVAETLDRQTLDARLSTLPPVLAAYEEPSRFAAAPVVSWGLSATHLVQSYSQRKPFRRQVLDPAGWWSGGAPFTKLPSAAMTDRLSDVHTLVLPATAGLLPEVPSRSGGSGYSLPLWEDEKLQRHPFAELGGAENLSLIVAPRAGYRQAYSLGQLAALQGVPSLLLGAGAQGDSKEFVAAYAQLSLGDARKKLQPGWLLLGDWGPDAAEAAKLGKSRFNEYGKAGVLAHNAGAYGKALSYFENALTIVAENPSLAKHRTQLHRYARESAFAAGFTGRAIIHADELVKGLAKEKPYSPEHADALLRLGLLQANAERFSAAAVSLKEAVGIFADLGMAKEQAAALADFGVVMENAVNFSAARTFFEEAAGLRRTLKDEMPLAEQYRNLGRIYDLRLNQYAVAGRYYAQAGEIYARSGNAALEAETLLEQGRCQRLLGNFPAADKLYGDALTKVGGKDLRTQMRIVLEQANNAWFQGRYQDAFDLREQVEKNAIAEKWPLEQVMAKNSGGLIWWTLGDNKRAQQELHGALERAEKLAVRRDEVATTLNNIGLVQRESGEYAKALVTLEKALAIDRTLGSRWAMAYDLRNLGQTRLKMGDATAALQQFSEAAVMASEIGDKVNLAKIYLARGDAETELKQAVAAEGSYRSALEIADALLLREVRWRALFGLARLQRNGGDTAKAVASYQQALETVEGLRAEIKLDQLKDGFLADKMDVYSGLVSLLVDLQRSDEAFAVAERSRSRNLIDILGRQRLSLSGSVDQELYDRQNRLKEQMLEQENLSVQAVNPKERARYTEALEKLRGDYQDLLIDIERKRPELLALVKVNPTTLADIRKLLEPGVVLLSYYQLADRLLCWKIDSNGATLIIKDVTAKDLGAKISSYRRMLQNLEPLEKQSRELYDLLVGQQLAGAGPIRALGIIPHGSLHYLAFATLSDGRDYLVDRQQLFYLPTASVLKYTLARRSPVKKQHILAVGNPDLGNPSLDLPFAEREAGTLRWNYPDVTTLTRERATESWIREHISEFGVIHIASHGEFDPVNPLFSAIRLAKDGKADGKLQAEEIFGLDIKADLVVLSACQTGLGDIRSGDDVVGMNRAFIFAGTHSLMSSLWRVSDVSTAIMMKQFYRNYTTYDKAESLTRAMQHVKNRYPHPGYWGAFVLTGDYQ
ncbi:MAG: CHAT domain-containing protein [Desulfuromonadaceae bacterium]|nr:CHAT domain-containing protein [Desulfuromonadaceae bacterium]MDD2849135.1 CHAT domain-containing protein [Desulfuromonadaceae bacterium]MDD4129503.1 CHAT domain-containing protein [Desulfuromonadaceae bacterium]